MMVFDCATQGCDTDPMGGIVTDTFGRTSVTGVYAAGDTAAIDHPRS
jgi:thioredoxin reductase